MSIERFVGVRPALCVLRTGVAVASAGLLLGACSADVARFDFPSLNVADKGGETGALPQPSKGLNRSGGDLAGEGPREQQSGNAVYTPPRANRGQDVQVSSLPEPAQPAAPTSTNMAPSGGQQRRTASAPVQPAPASQAAVPAAPAPAPPATFEKGEMIEVQQGDTLFGLAKRHKVSLAELTAANDLKTANLKPGQKLYLPAGRHAANGKPQKPLSRPAPLAAAAPAPAGNWEGSYTVKQGDSLYNIARQHKVQVAELQQVNGITDPRKVKPGVVLKVPGEGRTVGALQPTAAQPSAPAGPSMHADEGGRAPASRPTIINGSPRVAAAKPETATDAEPDAGAAPKADGHDKVASAATSVGAAAAGTGKLRWPAKGKIIAGFGPRSDGSHNDGINVAVPMGTDIHAAESGSVAYAGNELKGYGNLVLVRHDNGWVTAYAHAETMLVKRGDKVRRGQVIAKAGKSGTVDQPQVHFELRQGSKPVDPTPLMEKM